jgi:hypothetical protein
MNSECENYPENFDGYTPKEFAKKFVGTNYYYQEEVFKEMIEEYKKEHEGDIKKERKNLAKGLDRVIRGLKCGVLPGFERIGKACKNYMKNPFE